MELNLKFNSLVEQTNEIMGYKTQLEKKRLRMAMQLWKKGKQLHEIAQLTGLQRKGLKAKLNKINKSATASQFAQACNSALFADEV